MPCQALNQFPHRRTGFDRPEIVVVLMHVVVGVRQFGDAGGLTGPSANPEELGQFMFFRQVPFAHSARNRGHSRQSIRGDIGGEHPSDTGGTRLPEMLAHPLQQSVQRFGLPRVVSCPA